MHTKVKNCNSAYKSSCERFAIWNNDYILLIKHTPSAAGQKSHFFITKKSWKKFDVPGIWHLESKVWAAQIG